MEIVELGKRLLQEQLRGRASTENISAATEGLLGGLDISSIVQKMIGNAGGLAEIAQSWLGQGANRSISPGDVLAILGQDRISAFVSKLGVGQDTALSALSSVLPQLVDKASDAGNPDMSVGGLMDMAKKFL